MRLVSRLPKRFIRFGTVGALGVLVNSGALFLLHGVLGLQLLPASMLAVELAILNNYYWNERWTFRSAELSLGRLAKFNLTSLGGLLISMGMLYLLVTYVGIHYLVANLAGIVMATGWNFGLSLLWTWG